MVMTNAQYVELRNAMIPVVCAALGVIGDQRVPAEKVPAYLRMMDRATAQAVAIWEASTAPNIPTIAGMMSSASL